MSKGIISVTPLALKETTGIDILRHDPKDIVPLQYELAILKAILLLPADYTVHEVRQNDFAKRNDFVEIIVSSDDIPEVDDDQVLPDVVPLYIKNDDGNAELKEIKIISVHGNKTGQ